MRKARERRLGRDPGAIAYHGRRQADARPVWVTTDGDPLSPEPLQQIVVHSPDGYEWGYGGSGPADLALAMLTDYLLRTAQPTGITESANRTPEYGLAWALHQDFKWDVVGRLEHEAWTVTGTAIAVWLQAHDLGVRMATADESHTY